jgi:cytochrome c oxidase cbb3-type subunit 3
MHMERSNVSTPADHLTDHEYDGIREYDNPTPGWWTGIFVVTVILCVPYVVMYHFGPWGWDIQETHSQAVADDLKRQFGEIGDLESDEPTLLRYMTDPKWLPVGEVVFRTNCVQCHGPQGAGQAGGGVNLTDDYYKNVKRLADIPRIISEGANNGAMPAWRTRLHRNEIVLAACYVANLRGKDLAGRPREGEVIPPWPKPPEKAAPSDSGAKR